MASATKIRKVRQKQRARKAGRRRKRALAANGTTSTAAELFGDPEPAA